MRARLIWAVAVLPGCFHTFSYTVCEEQVTAVADDEVTDQGTASELLARVTGVRDEPAVLEDGTPVVATVQVDRADGTAEHVALHTAQLVTKRTFGIGDTRTLNDPLCEDYLRVPTEIALQTDDGWLDVVLPATARTADTAGPDGDEVQASLPFATSGFPDPADVDLSEWDDQEAFVDVHFYPEGFTAGDVGWWGVDDNRSTAWTYVTWEP